MSRYKLLEHLSFQLKLLNHHLGQIDDLDILAYEIAVRVRVLVHDTGKSTSLLTLLQSKNINYYDTCVPSNSIAYWKGNFTISGWNLNLLPHIGIVAKDVSVISQEELKITYFPVFKEWTFKANKVDFNTWWDTTIFDNKNGNTLTRKELILNAANKDGGAHIDQVSPSYEKFSKNDVMLFRMNNINKTSENIPVFSCIAQIGWELYESITDSGII